MRATSDDVWVPPGVRQTNAAERRTPPADELCDAARTAIMFCDDVWRSQRRHRAAAAAERAAGAQDAACTGTMARRRQGSFLPTHLRYSRCGDRSKRRACSCAAALAATLGTAPDATLGDGDNQLAAPTRRRQVLCKSTLLDDRQCTSSRTPPRGVDPLVERILKRAGSCRASTTTGGSPLICLTTAWDARHYEHCDVGADHMRLSRLDHPRDWVDSMARLVTSRGRRGRPPPWTNDDASDER